MSRKKQDSLILCLGVDDKLHVCYPWEHQTQCGIPIKSKGGRMMMSRPDQPRLHCSDIRCARYTY